MSCCEIEKVKSGPRSLLALVASAVLIVLVPKCPLCVAAYAASLGLGMSVVGATVARDLAMALALVLVGVWIRGMVTALRRFR